MIDRRTGQPIDPNWQPMLAIHELPDANALMERNNLHFSWQWIPATLALGGTIILSTH